MEGSVKFSVLVPVYKAEEYLRQCVDSVLSQSYTNFELILIDDGSPDKSGAICDDYAAKDQRVKVIHKPNGGALESRCLAVETAGGDYCIFLDSDDYITADALETLAGYIAEHKADCIIYGIEWLKPGGHEYVRCKEEYCGRLISDKAYALSIILNDSSYNSLCRKCVRADCFRGRDLSPYYHIRQAEDRLQSLEILENAESFLFVRDVLYFYRVNSTSVTHTLNYDGYRADFTVDRLSLETAKKLGLFSPSDFDRLRNFSLDALVVELKRLSRFCSDNKNSVSGFASIRECEYYNEFLSAGYKKAPALPGITERKGIRRLMNRIAHFLFKHRLYSLLIFFNKYIYK